MRSVTILSILVLCTAFVFAQQGGGRGRPGGRPAGAAEQGGPPIAVAEISSQFRTISVGGRLQPISNIAHRITTGGYIKSVDVKEGQWVEAGQELFTIERKDDVLNLYVPAAVTARISGRISKVVIRAEDEVSSGQAAVVIIGTAGYVLEANVSDKDAFKIGIGRWISARTTAGAVIRGILASRSQEPDYATGLFVLTFEFPANQRTHVGEFVIIELPVDQIQGIFVPREVAVRRYGKHFVWVVKEDRTLEAREVQLGATYGDMVQVTEGLNSGERYLTRLSGRERDGSPIGEPRT